MKQYTHITAEDRDTIAILKCQGITISEIGRRLGRNKSSISRELKRNSSSKYDCYAGHRAHQRAEFKAKKSHRHPRLRDPVVRKYVNQKLHKLWSPELIAGRLSQEHPMHTISTEAIYQYIYDPSNPRSSKQIALLRHRHRHRRPKGRANRKHTTKIPNRVSIEQRPEHVLNREQFGHWETDTLVSRKSSSALVSMTERKSRLLFIDRVDAKTAENTASVIIRRFNLLPRHARLSATADNGTEFAAHEFITASTGVKFFFAHPYSSWERGTNENRNGFIRWLLPKGTDFSTITDRQIQTIESLHNNRPMKCLGFKTPNECASSIVALAY